MFSLSILDQSKFGQMSFNGANLQGTMMERDCPRNPTCDPRSRYRSIDGSCNNLRNTKLGMALTPLRRVLYNNYDDGKLARFFIIQCDQMF